MWFAVLKWTRTVLLPINSFYNQVDDQYDNANL